MSAPADGAAALPSAEYLAEDNGPGMVAAIWTIASLATIALFLRCYVRVAIKNVFGIDDWTVVVAWVLLICFCAVDTLAQKLGLGRHVMYLALNADPADIADIIFFLWLGNAFAVMGNALAKISFAFTLMRVLPQKWMKIVLWCIIVSLFTINAVLTVLIYAQCEDPRTLWNPAVYPGSCWPTYVLTGFALFTGAWSGAMDFTLAALPWFIIPKLKMKLRDKMGVAIGMSLGVVAGVAAIVKSVQLQTLNSDDATFQQPSLIIWGGVEVSLTIIAACIPTLRPLGKVIFGGSTTDRYGSGKDARGSSYQLGRMGGGTDGHADKSGSMGDNFNPRNRGVNKTLVTIGSKQSRAKSPGVMVLDDDSDKSILGGHTNSGNSPGSTTVGRRGTSVSESVVETRIETRPGLGERGRSSGRGGITATHEVRVQYE